MHDLSIIDHDGINLFYNGEWTLVELSTLEHCEYTIQFLQTLTVDQLEHWIDLNTGSHRRKEMWQKLSDETK